jgi:hypothetical protein
MVRERRAFGSIRKLTSGRYQGIYTGPDLLRHMAPTTFTAKIDVEGWLHEERKLIEATSGLPRSTAPRRPGRRSWSPTSRPTPRSGSPSDVRTRASR